MKSSQIVMPVTDSSQIGEVRRRASQLATEIGLPEPDRAKVAIVATEMATNLTRYAMGGEMILSSVGGNGESHRWVEVISVDRGPGMENVSQCLTDGFSTSGGVGNGMGAVRRLSSEWDVYSLPASASVPAGSVVFSRVTQNGDPVLPGSFVWGAVTRPAPHEALCGDTWRIAERQGGFTLMMADGLGHGPDAAQAAAEAGDVFDADPFADLQTMLHNANVRMQRTRGAAVATARFEAAGRTMRFVGVGNIAASVQSRAQRESRGLVSHNGIVGSRGCKIQEFQCDCPEDSLLVMHSDGLQSRWSLEPYPGLRARHPAVIASVLYRDFTRGRDDVTVAVVRLSE